MIALGTTTFLVDLHKHSKDINYFPLFMALRLFELKYDAVTVKMNVIYFGVDTILRPFHEAPI